MNRLHLTLIVIGVLIVSPPLWFYATGRAWVVGMVEADEWAQELIRAGRPAKDCLKLDTILPTYPQEWELESYCVRKYARLSHDPSSCEFLMPSGPGLSCVEEAKAGSLRCSLDNVNRVQGNGVGVPLQDCVKGDENIRNNPCCKIAIVTAVQNENDCSIFSSTPEFLDDCHYQVAYKNHDPAACMPIQNPILLSACLIQAKALRQDPSICQGCRKPVETVEELLEL